MFADASLIEGSEFTFVAVDKVVNFLAKLV